MAAEMFIKIEQDEWDQHDDDLNFNPFPLDTATEAMKEEMKEEMKAAPESLHKTVDDIHFATVDVKLEIKTEPGSPHKTVDDVQGDYETDNGSHRVEEANELTAADLLARLCKPVLHYNPSSSSYEILQPCLVVMEKLVENVETKPEPGFSCGLCSLSYKTKTLRDRHQRLSCRRRFDASKPTPSYETLHSEDGPDRFSCNECKYSTEDLDNMKTHLLLHLDGRYYACRHCNFKATQYANLERHFLTHKDINIGRPKPFTCKICKFQTVHQSSLVTHVRVHTGEKPFKCTQCDYASSQSSAMLTHKRSMHTKEHPYACTLCKFSCVQSGNFLRHVKRHEMKLI